MSGTISDMSIIHGVDLSRWQAGLTIDQVMRDPLGVRFVNISLSKGVSAPVNIGQNRQIWAGEARNRGLIRLGYHWLTGETSGASQWAACKREALVTFGSLTGWGLQVDCEDTSAPASYQQLVDFVTAAKADLKRPIVLYSGDWWLDGRKPAWPDLSALTPYLWAAANAGWLTGSPVELSKHWRWTSRGGWSHLSLMQWDASRTIGGIKVSSSVVRNPEVLCALTGEHLEIL